MSGLLDQRELFVVVHGVGRQAELETLRTFVEGIARLQITGAAFSRAELADLASTDGDVAVHVNKTRIPFVEINYASNIHAHEAFAEEDIKRWLKSFRYKLKEMNAKRGDKPNEEFWELEDGVDDILLATKLARLIAGRFHVSPGELDVAATSFLQQIQLYIDRRSYREGIHDSVCSSLETIGAKSKRIVLVTHSLGTVVTMRAMVDAFHNGQPWINSVSRFVTFGSPIDLFLVLYKDEIFGFEGAGKTKNSIPWRNYFFGNDPIASDLAVARQWVKDHAPNLFVHDSPQDFYLGPGPLATAHTEYWHSEAMLRNVDSNWNGSRAAARETPEAAQEPAVAEAKQAESATLQLEDEIPTYMHTLLKYRPFLTVFLAGSILATLATAWLMLVWWEENTKHHDAQRIVLDTPLHQSLMWLLSSALIWCHVASWSAPKALRLGCAIGALVFAVILADKLPPLPILGSFTQQKDFYDDITSDDEKQIRDSAAHPDKNGNYILLMIPLFAFGGVISRRRWLKAKYVGVGLAMLVVVLSLFVGTRSDPANIGSEFEVLGLTFGLWWLSILLAKTHRVFRAFVDGRQHIELLCRYWKIPKAICPIRTL